MASQMSNIWDQAGGIWAQGQLTGKVGSVMASTATQHGGQETTLFSGITNLMHFGMVIVGLPYSYQVRWRSTRWSAAHLTARPPSPADKVSAYRRRTKRRPLSGPSGGRDGRQTEGRMRLPLEARQPQVKHP